MIYTTYFANLKNLPKNVAPISIATKTPKWYGGLVYKNLAPNMGLLLKYKRDYDEEYYKAEFTKYLDTLDINKVLEDISLLITSHERYYKGIEHIALVCYEAPDKFCHRHMVADWLNENYYGIVDDENDGTVLVKEWSNAWIRLS